MQDNGKHYTEGFVIICYDTVNNIKNFKDHCLTVNARKHNINKKHNRYIIHFVCSISML